MTADAHGSDSTRPVHGGIKEAELRALGLRLEDCLDFSASVSPLGPPQGVAAAIAAVDLTAYPDPHCLALTEAIAAHHVGDGVSIGNVIVGNGSTEIIHLLTRAWIGSPPAGCAQSALLLTPTYGEYDGAVRISGGNGVDTHRDPVQRRFRLGHGRRRRRHRRPTARPDLHLQSQQPHGRAHGTGATERLSLTRC